MNSRTTLAQRLGKTVHVSPLRFKLERLRRKFPSSGAVELEDWLVDVANARGARVVERPRADSESIFEPPPPEALTNEELVTAICQFERLDRPQMLRLAAQFVSSRRVDFPALRIAAERERAGGVLGELARQALRVDPSHGLWSAISGAFPQRIPFSSALLHWTRLAEPVFKRGRCNAASWRLAA